MTDVRIINFKSILMGYNSLWSKVTGSLYKAVLTQAISGITVCLLSVVSVIMINSDPIGYVKGGGFQTILILIMIAGIGSLVGFILFFINITKLKEQVNSLDAQAVGNIHTAMILAIIYAIVSVIGRFVLFMNIIALVLSIVAFAFQFMGYSALKSSTTFPEIARAGAGKIFTAMILNLVGLVICWIPIIGFISVILSIFALVFTLNGWKLISKAE